MQIKRPPLTLEDVLDERQADTGPPMVEPQTTLQARVPWSVAERVRLIARNRSRRSGRRVTVTEVLVEAISLLDD